MSYILEGCKYFKETLKWTASERWRTSIAGLMSIAWRIQGLPEFASLGCLMRCEILFGGGSRRARGRKVAAPLRWCPPWIRHRAAQTLGRGPGCGLARVPSTQPVERSPALIVGPRLRHRPCRADPVCTGCRYVARVWSVHSRARRRPRGAARSP